MLFLSVCLPSVNILEYSSLTSIGFRVTQTNEFMTYIHWSTYSNTMAIVTKILGMQPLQSILKCVR